MVLGLVDQQFSAGRFVLISQIANFLTLVGTYIVWDLILGNESGSWVPFISDVGDMEDLNEGQPWIYFFFAWVETCFSMMSVFSLWIVYTFFQAIFKENHDKKLYYWFGVIPLILGCISYLSMGLTAHVCSSCSWGVHKTLATLYFTLGATSIITFFVVGCFAFRFDQDELKKWINYQGISCAFLFGVSILFAFTVTFAERAIQAIFEWLTVLFLHICLALFSIPMFTYKRSRIVLVIDQEMEVIPSE